MTRYIDSYIPAGKELLVFVDTIGNPKLSKNGKNFYPIKYRIASSSELVDAAIFETTIQYEFNGNLPQVGTQLALSKNDKGFVTHRVVSSGEPRNNYQDIKVERQVTKEVNAKDIEIALLALNKSWAETGKFDNPEEVADIAKRHWHIIAEDVLSILENE